MDQYTKDYFTQIYDQISNVVEGEGTYNIIAANATVNPSFRQTTGGIARHIMAKKADLIGMTPNEIENDPYKATAKFLTQSITDVGVRVFNNTHKQLMSQGMEEHQAALYAEKVASSTVRNLVQPLYSPTFEQQRNAVDNLISIMTTPNIDNGRIEIDLNRIAVDPEGKRLIKDSFAFEDNNKQYTVRPINTESYTPFISQGIDLGGEWLEGSVKYIGALGSSTLIGQAITGTAELFGFDAAEWLGARREFEREVMRKDDGIAWSIAYGGRDLVATIAETAAIKGATGGWAGPVVQTPIRSMLNEWVEESGQLSMQYVTGDERQESNTRALLSNLAFDTATMAASVGAGKIFESAFQSAAVTNASMKMLGDHSTGTFLRNILRTGTDLVIDSGIDFFTYSAMGANMDDESMLTQNTRNIYDKLSRMPDFQDPEYNEALLNFVGRKMAGRFIGGLQNLKPKSGDPYFDTPAYHRAELKMNKVLDYVNRLFPPSSFRDVDLLIRGRAQAGGSGPVTLKAYIDGGHGFKDLFKMYLDREFAQSKILTASGIHSAIFGEQKLWGKFSFGKGLSTVPAQDKLYTVTQVIDDLDEAVKLRGVDEINAGTTGTKVVDAIVGKMVERSLATKDEQFAQYAENRTGEQGSRTDMEFLRDMRVEYNKQTDKKLSLTDQDTEKIVTEVASWVNNTLNYKDKKAKTIFVNSFVRTLDKQLRKYGFDANHKAAMMKAAEYIKNQTVPNGTGAPKAVKGGTLLTDQERIDFQQDLMDRFVNEGNIANKRKINIAVSGSPEYKVVEADSEEFKTYIRDRLKRVGGTNFLSGIGIGDSASRKILKMRRMRYKVLPVKCYRKKLLLMDLKTQRV
jgi:hypothetical protein